MSLPVGTVISGVFAAVLGIGWVATTDPFIGIAAIIAAVGSAIAGVLSEMNRRTGKRTEQKAEVAANKADVAARRTDEMASRYGEHLQRVEGAYTGFQRSLDSAEQDRQEIKDKLDGK